ncbi:MAG: nucleotidyltransferase domain-containing protein [Pseudomonadota bacterium]
MALPPTDLAETLLRTRYPGAEAAFWAGSLSRGEGTPTSDLDLVVLYPGLEHAWRETVETQGRLCDLFVHDPISLEIFFAKDVDRGRPTLMQMVAEGISLRPGALADNAKAMARRVLDDGPRVWSQAEIDRSRFLLGDLLDDLRGASDVTEIRSIGVALYAPLFEHHRRTRRVWSAGGKQIARTLLREEGAFGRQFLSAFDTLFERGDAQGVIDLTGLITTPSGGVLRYWRQDAPPHRSV